jgi:hypothetical protein
LSSRRQERRLAIEILFQADVTGTDGRAALAGWLESGPQPEFDLLFVASWHMSRKNVADASQHQIFVAVVEIPE